MSRVQPVIDRLVEHLDELDPGTVLGLYLFGSSVNGGPRPDSDIDLLVVTDRSLSLAERASLVSFLLEFSGRRATTTPGRPLELTSVVLSDVAPWSYPPACDFLYGEWLRAEVADGRLPQPHANPDLAVLITGLRQQAKVLRGPDPAELLDPVPSADLHRAVHDSLEPLLGDLDGDERNVLLTLARMVVTLDSGEILSKDAAAQRIIPTLTAPRRTVMAWAVAGYLGEIEDDWSQCQAAARHTALGLAALIRAKAPRRR